MAHVRQSRPDPDLGFQGGGTQDTEMSKSLSTLRLEGSPTQSGISPSIQRILRESGFRSARYSPPLVSAYPLQGYLAHKKQRSPRNLQ